MQLILLRHGKAEDTSPDGDFSRILLEKGREQSRHAARVLEATHFLPDLVLSSPVIRARQTAEIFSTAASIPGPILQDWLSCGMSPETALASLTLFTDFARVMIVGHEPDFSRLIQHCLGTTAECIEVRKGSMTCITLQPPCARATLHFLLPYKLGKHLP